MSDPWNYAGPVTQWNGGMGSVTLVDESSFVISEATGDIRPDSAHGLFVRDTRLLSGFELRIDGMATEPLAAVNDDPFSATFVSRGRPAPGRADSTVMVFRERHVGQGMFEQLTLRNFADEALECEVALSVAVDFADLFAVKEGRVDHQRQAVACEVEVVPPTGAGDAGPAVVVRYVAAEGPRGREVALRFHGDARIEGGSVRFVAQVPAHGEWSTCCEVAPVFNGTLIEPRYRCGEPIERAMPSERLANWRQQVPQVTSDDARLKTVVTRSLEDLGALRIFDPDYPERVVVAAGAPWFMTVFGRDSLLTAWMALLIDPELARGVLQTLARFQGRKVDPAHDEEPGRILHEMRFSEAASLSLGGGSIYYGTADATPLFVMLLGELRRWDVARDLVDELLPNAEAAIAWIEHFGDADGDGYVEYHRSSERGLANQGWKDSWDGIRYGDGRVAEAPIALAEVQAYTYGAYLAMAHFAFEANDTATYERFRAKATALKVAFNRDFWLEDHGWFAVGLDANKQPIDSLTSNIGHCLWTGIVDEDKAARVVEALMSEDMFTGWGLRTLSASSGGYNPISYHCGSVWPHDTAIVAAGLARYGYDAEAQRVIFGLLDAAVAESGRLPELFSGLARSELSTPVGYPTSCSPQAWAAASPLLCLRTLLRLDPWIPYGKIWLSPNLPDFITYLKVDGIPLAGTRVTIEVGSHVEGGVRITGLPANIEVVRAPRPPLTSVGRPTTGG
jgi:glycogen debranching enzyme